MALHLPTGPLKTHLGWSRYKDANPVSISPLADDLATVESSLGRLLFSIGYVNGWAANEQLVII